MERGINGRAFAPLLRRVKIETPENCDLTLLQKRNNVQKYLSSTLAQFLYALELAAVAFDFQTAVANRRWHQRPVRLLIARDTKNGYGKESSSCQNNPTVPLPSLLKIGHLNKDVCHIRGKRRYTKHWR
jgi:hypothetical protein